MRCSVVRAIGCAPFGTDCLYRFYCTPYCLIAEGRIVPRAFCGCARQAVCGPACAVDRRRAHLSTARLGASKSLLLSPCMHAVHGPLEECFLAFVRRKKIGSKLHMVHNWELLPPQVSQEPGSKHIPVFLP